MLVLADKNSHWPNNIFCRLVTVPSPPRWCSQLGLFSTSGAGATQSPPDLSILTCNTWPGQGWALAVGLDRSSRSWVCIPRGWKETPNPLPLESGVQIAD